jgi:hypothetical protein
MRIIFSENSFIYFLSFLFFLLLLPYFVWHTPLIRHAVEVIFIVGCIPFIEKKISKNQIILSSLLLLLLLYLITQTSVTGLISNLFLLVIFFLKSDFKIKLLDCVISVFAIGVGISLLVYILVCWLSMPFPSQVLEPLNPLKETEYLQYPFLVVYNSPYNFANMRFYSVFDEPGVVGTVAALLLYSNEYKLNSWKFIIIFIAGIFSFSFFFIVMSFLCLFRKSYIKYILFFIVFSIIIYLLFKDFFIKNGELFNSLIFSRFTADGNYGGDRVSSLFNREYYEFLVSNDVFFGRGSEELSKILSGGSSYKSLVYSNGVIWFIGVCLFFILNILTISQNKKIVFYSTIIFLGVLYQRPNIFDLPYFFMFITLPLVLQVRSLDKTESATNTVG